MQWRDFPARVLRWLDAAGLAVVAHAEAGRPLVTDDATIVDRRSCQLEAWLQRAQDGALERWALPACNFGTNLELTAGGASLRQNAEASRLGLLQAKSVLHPLEPGGWGLAVSLADTFDPHVGLRGDLHLNLPLSLTLADGWLVHANLGWLHQRQPTGSRATWGLASEFAAGPRTGLMAEIFSLDSGRPHYQLAARQWLLPQRLQVDASVGSRFGAGRGARFASIGLTWFTPAFLP